MGGVQRYILTISEEMMHRGIRSTVLTRYYPLLPKMETFPSYTVHRIGFNPIPFSHNKKINSITTKLGDLFTYTRLGYPEARKHASKSMLVHSQFAILSDVELAHRIARKTKRKHIVTVHIQFGSKCEDFPPTSKAFNLLRGVNHVIVNRQSSIQLLNYLGIENASFLTNPVSCEFYKQPEEEFNNGKKEDITRILFVGRLVERRGPRLALEAFSEALGINPKMELYIVGSGVLERSLKRFIKQNRLGAKVRMIGERKDVRPYLWMSDIFLAPSAVANSPSIAMREAMAAGLAIIATDVEDTKSIVKHGKTGLLCEVSTESLAESIAKLSSQRSFLEKLGKAAAKYAEQNLDVTTYVNQLIRIYKKVIE
jgi:glycosyltransferase involved in cell wall biosynthesis